MQKGFAPILAILFVTLITLAVGALFVLRPDFFQNIKPTSVDQIASHSFNPSEITNPSLISNQKYPVSFAKIDDEFYILYKGEVYHQRNFGTEKVDNIKSEQYKWQKLVDSPIKTSEAKFIDDEMYALTAAPNNKDFIFTMRWTDPNNSKNPFNVYYYQEGMSKYPLTKINNDDWKINNYAVPEVDQISPEGKLVLFNLYGCSNCGGHTPEKLIVDLSNGKLKKIGKLSYFKWGINGEYEYKEYKQIECPPIHEGLSTCSEKIENLPLLKGKFD